MFRLPLLAMVGLLALAPLPAVAQLTAKIEASRGTVGAEVDVAPLAVFFDARSTTWTGSTDVQRWQDLHYRWDFGDPDAGRWERGNPSGDAGNKNVAFGPMAAHVFESPGNHTVTLTVTDTLGGTSDTATAVIRVDDPDTVFSGSKTICLSNDADFSGCPAGADQVTTSNWNAVKNEIAPNRRVLLKRGDTFSGSGAVHPKDGPGHLGAFGSGARPKVPVTGLKIDVSATQDWRITGINFNGTGGTCVSRNDGSIGSRVLHVLFMDLQMTNGGCGGWIYSLGPFVFRERAAANEHFFIHGGEYFAKSNESTAIWLGGIGWSVQGIDMTIDGAVHGVRTPWSEGFIIAHNEIRTQNEKNGKQVIKLAPESIDQLGRSGWYIVADNVFNGSNGVMMQLGEGEGSSSATESSYSLVERNYLRGTNSQLIARSATRYAVIRNNISTITREPTEPAWVIHTDDVQKSNFGREQKVYNNTHHWKNPNGNVDMFFVENNAPGSVLKNNLLYCEGCGGANVVNGPGDKAANLLIRSAPESGNGSQAEHFQIKAGSEAVGAAVAVPAVFDDYTGSLRQGPLDVGAFGLNTVPVSDGGSPPVPPDPSDPPPPPPPPPPPDPPPILPDPPVAPTLRAPPAD